MYTHHCEAGYDICNIVKETVVSQGAGHWVKRCHEYSPQITPTQSKCPRLASKLSRTSKPLKLLLNTRPTLTAHQMEKENPALLEYVSDRTVSCYMQENLTFIPKLLHQSPYCEKQKESCYFCPSKYSTWSIEKSKAILWWDGSTVIVTEKPSRWVLWLRSMNRYHPQYTVKTEKHSDS